MVKKVVATWWLSSTTLSLYRSVIKSFITTRDALVKPRQSKSWHNAARAKANIFNSFNLCAPYVKVSNKYLQPTFHPWFQNNNCDYTNIKHKQHVLSLPTSRKLQLQQYFCIWQGGLCYLKKHKGQIKINDEIGEGTPIYFEGTHSAWLLAKL
jgi:hypothetical protein